MISVAFDAKILAFLNCTLLGISAHLKQVVCEFQNSLIPRPLMLTNLPTSVVKMYTDVTIKYHGWLIVSLIDVLMQALK